MFNHLNIKKNVITSVVAFSINILLTFISYRLLIQQGGLEALGVWSILSAAIFVLRVGDIGMGSAAERYTAMLSVETHAKEIRHYFDTAFTINTVLFSALAIIGYLLFSNNIEWIIPNSKDLQKQAISILPLMFMVFFISNIANIFNGGLRGLHQGYLGAYLSIISNIIQMTIVIILVPRIGLAGLAWGQLAQYLFIVVVAWGFIHKHIKEYSKVTWLPIYVSKKKIKELFNFSLKVQAVSLLNGLFEPLSKFLVGHTAGLSILGLYELAYKIVSLPRHAIVAGVLGVMPAVTNLLVTNVDEAKRLYFKSKKLVVLVTTIILCGVILVSPVISWILFKKIEWILINFIIILVVGFLGNVMGAPAYTLGFSSGKLKGNIYSSLLALAILSLGLIIGDFTDIYGVVISSALGLFFAGYFIKMTNENLLSNFK